MTSTIRGPRSRRPPTVDRRLTGPQPSPVRVRRGGLATKPPWTTGCPMTSHRLAAGGGALATTIRPDYGMSPGYVARRSRDDGPPPPLPPRDQVPELTPIMKPMSAMPPQYAPTEPPPLTPIFPALGQPSAPPSNGRRRREEPVPEVPMQPARRGYDGFESTGDIRRPRPRPAGPPPAPAPPVPREPLPREPMPREQMPREPLPREPMPQSYAGPASAPPRGRRSVPDETRLRPASPARPPAVRFASGPRTG